MTQPPVAQAPVIDAPPPAGAGQGALPDVGRDTLQGRGSLIATSPRGVLTMRPGNLRRKILLGE